MPIVSPFVGPPCGFVKLAANEARSFLGNDRTQPFKRLLHQGQGRIIHGRPARRRGEVGVHEAVELPIHQPVRNALGGVVRRPTQDLGGIGGTKFGHFGDDFPRPDMVPWQLPRHVLIPKHGGIAELDFHGGPSPWRAAPHTFPGDYSLEGQPASTTSVYQDSVRNANCRRRG
ncbi:hypothetical protein D3C71_1580470 [compost metagenome]